MEIIIIIGLFQIVQDYFHFALIPHLLTNFVYWPIDATLTGSNITTLQQNGSETLLRQYKAS